MSLGLRQVDSLIKPGEWHDVLWHQYMNCVDSLRMQSAESASEGGAQAFASHPSWEAFEGNVDILEAMCEGYDLLDDIYKKQVPEGTKTTRKKAFSALTAMLKRQTFWKEARPYLGRI